VNGRCTEGGPKVNRRWIEEEPLVKGLTDIQSSQLWIKGWIKGWIKLDQAGSSGSSGSSWIKWIEASRSRSINTQIKSIQVDQDPDQTKSQVGLVPHFRYTG
jgi:hypothetical protein